jgi:hypothetical protein
VTGFPRSAGPRNNPCTATGSFNRDAPSPRRGGSPSSRVGTDGQHWRFRHGCQQSPVHQRTAGSSPRRIGRDSGRGAAPRSRGGHRRPDVDRGFTDGPRLAAGLDGGSSTGSVTPTRPVSGAVQHGPPTLPRRCRHRTSGTAGVPGQRRATRAARPDRCRPARSAWHHWPTASRIHGSPSRSVTTAPGRQAVQLLDRSQRRRTAAPPGGQDRGHRLLRQPAVESRPQQVDRLPPVRTGYQPGRDGTERKWRTWCSPSS